MGYGKTPVPNEDETNAQCDKNENVIALCT